MVIQFHLSQTLISGHHIPVPALALTTTTIHKYKIQFITFFVAMSSGIYKIQSLSKPHLFYIGSSINIEKRWRQHIHRLKVHKHENQRLQNHVNKYGLDDLIFTIMFSCDLTSLIIEEQAYLNMSKPAFNILKTCHPFSYQPSKLTTRQKIANSWKQRPPISMFSRLFKSKRH